MRKSVLAGFLAVVVLGSCATGNWRDGMRPWWTLTDRDFTAITRDQTKAEVERALGKPLFVETFTNLREEVWDYRLLSGVQKKAAEIHFDMEGRVTNVVTYPDNCPFGPIGCR
jgi:outer membrane protein assembly factor BamE (lipoprotein component of BamABCDE complex)